MLRKFKKIKLERFHFFGSFNELIWKNYFLCLRKWLPCLIICYLYNVLDKFVCSKPWLAKIMYPEGFNYWNVCTVWTHLRARLLRWDLCSFPAPHSSATPTPHSLLSFSLDTPFISIKNKRVAYSAHYNGCLARFKLAEMCINDYYNVQRAATPDQITK